MDKEDGYAEHAKPHGNAARRVLAALLALIILLVIALVLFTLHLGAGTPSVSHGTELQQPPAPTEPTQPAPPPTESSEPTETTEPTETSEPPVEPPEVALARERLDQMTLEEKLYQLLIVTPETLTGAGVVDIAGPLTEEALSEYPVCGLVYFGQNIYSEEQITNLISGSQEYARFPLLICVDEEGGRVSRLSGIGVTDEFEPMAVYGAAGDPDVVRQIGRTLGAQITAVGFNVDFAPVADVVTNPNNTEIGDRSFSDDPEVAAEMVAEMVAGLHEGGAISCLKHFPGHGSTEADSHEGLSVTDRTLDELRQTELLPFRAGIEAGTDMIMISHMSAPEITGDETPCDLSPVIVTDLLRGELGYDGVVITDSHEMGAILDYYSTGEAAVLAIQAGCDIVLMPNDIDEAIDALLTAVRTGELTEERIDESVLRILVMKYRWNVME